MKLGYADTSHKWLSQDDRALATYNAWDTVNTARLTAAIRSELSDNGQLEFFEQSIWPTVEPVMAMARRGLELDRDALKAYRKQVAKELRETDGVIRASSVWEDLNLNSPQQKAKWLYSDRPFGLGLKCPKTTPTGSRSTDQDTLIRVLRDLRKKDDHARPALEALFHRSRLNTIKTRYLKLEADPDGRVRPGIKMYGTETGRLAYADPPLQQWPPEARHIFKAGEGKVYVASDYSQLEARILAFLSGDQVSSKAFRDSGDVHAANARDLFGWSDEEWDMLGADRRKASRNFAKSFLYGISYGGQPETIKTKLFCPCPRCASHTPPTLKLKRTEIRRASDRWFYLHRPVLEWRDALLREVLAKHSYTNPLGRKRYFFQPMPSVEREVYNFPMQSIAADIMNRAMVGLHRIGAPMVLNMQDMLMLEVPEREETQWALRLKTVMEMEIPELEGTRFPVDLSRGNNWGSLESLTLN